LLEKDCYIRRGRQARNIIALLRSATCCLWYGFAMDAVTKARQSRCYGMLTHWRGIIPSCGLSCITLRGRQQDLFLVQYDADDRILPPLNKRISQISESFTKPKYSKRNITSVEFKKISGYSNEAII